MTVQQVASVQTIGRASLVLGALSDGALGGMRLSQVTDTVGLGKTTTLRLLKALVEVGYVEFDETEKLYRLGYALFRLGTAARRFHIIDLAQPGITRLAEATGDTVFLSVRDGDQARCIDRCTGSYPIRSLTLSVGDRRPLGVGAGSLALLAFEPDAEVARIMNANRSARQAFAAFDDDSLRAMIADTRRDGFARNDGRIVSAMNAVGVPVRDGAGRVVAALSIAAIRERMKPPRMADLVAQLKAEARDLGQNLDSRGRTVPGIR